MSLQFAKHIISDIVSDFAILCPFDFEFWCFPDLCIFYLFYVSI